VPAALLLSSGSRNGVTVASASSSVWCETGSREPARLCGVAFALAMAPRRPDLVEVTVSVSQRSVPRGAALRVSDVVRNTGLYGATFFLAVLLTTVCFLSAWLAAGN
jgi:hypothetical protein